MEKQTVLFICTQNGARSQMAEGFLRSMYGDRFIAFSAGSKPSAVHPFAVKVMKDLNIDIARHRSKNIDEFRGMNFDYVVTVCDNARQTCPFFPGAKAYLHKSFSDPAAIIGSDDDIEAGFIRARNEIRQWIREKFGRRSE